jgi:DNA-binding NtrC family response regulator
MGPRERSKPTRRPRRAHPLADLAEAESALEDLSPPKGTKVARPSSELGPFDTLKGQAVQWSAEQTLQTFRSLACAVTADLDLRSLVKQILEAGVRTLGAERGILFLGRGDSAGLVPVMALNIEGDELQSLERVSRTILQMGKGGAILLTQDAMNDPRLRAVDSVKLNEIRSILCMPLIGSSERVGVLYLDAPAPNAFAPDAERLLGAFADIAARALENARIHGDVLQENAQLRRQPIGQDPFDRLTGASSLVDALRRRARTVAMMDAPCLIRGERGTGRQILARAIHDAGSRALQPFLSCDCSTLSPEELKGFFLGRMGVAARGSRSEETGQLERAHRGTVFLSAAESLGVENGDQIARIMDRGTVRPLGGRHDIRVDLRFILSTSKDPEEEVRLGHWSRELFRKVRRLTLMVPSLRERPGDIPEMVAQLVRVYGNVLPGTPSVTFTAEALQRLQTHSWPGNVEELQHVVRRLLLLSKTDTIGAALIEQALLPPPEQEARVQGPWSGLVLPLVEWEREAIRQTLARTRGNKSEAARLLGVHRNTLVRKVKELKS